MFEQGERRLKSILSAEKVAYSDFLQKEAELIANIRELDASDDFNDFRGMSNNQMVPLWPADWTVTDLDTEVLLKSELTCVYQHQHFVIV